MDGQREARLPLTYCNTRPSTLKVNFYNFNEVIPLLVPNMTPFPEADESRITNRMSVDVAYST